MCSSLGQQLIEEDIKKEGLTRVVVAACSPHLHEKTFRRACENAGLNPYLLQMTNVREHVSWVTNDKAAGTAKTKALVAAAVGRVKYQQPLERMYVKVNPATLVVGGGIAGLQATLELADAGYPVYLVEREPSIGGHMAQFDKTFPTLDCSACILTPKMSEVGPARERHLVDLLRAGRGERLGGQFQGEDPPEGPARRWPNKCTGCGICVEKCPRKVVDDVFEVGMGNRKAIYTPFPQAVPRIPVIDTANCTWFTKRQVPGLREGLPDQGHRLRAAGRDRRAGGGQHHHGHRLEALRLQAGAAIRLRAAGQRLHQHGVRAALQRGRPDQRQDRPPRRQDRAQVGGHHPLRGQPRQHHEPLLLGRLLHGGLEVRPPRAGEDQGRGLLVLHRHAAPTRRTTRSSTSGCWRKACTSSAARWPK